VGLLSSLLSCLALVLPHFIILLQLGLLGRVGLADFIFQKQADVDLGLRVLSAARTERGRKGRRERWKN